MKPGFFGRKTKATNCRMAFLLSAIGVVLSACGWKQEEDNGAAVEQLVLEEQRYFSSATTTTFTIDGIEALESTVSEAIDSDTISLQPKKSEVIAWVKKDEFVYTSNRDRVHTLYGLTFALFSEFAIAVSDEVVTVIVPVIGQLILPTLYKNGVSVFTDGDLTDVDLVVRSPGTTKILTVSEPTDASKPAAQFEFTGSGWDLGLLDLVHCHGFEFECINPEKSLLGTLKEHDGYYELTVTASVEWDQQIVEFHLNAGLYPTSGTEPNPYVPCEFLSDDTLLFTCDYDFLR